MSNNESSDVELSPLLPEEAITLTLTAAVLSVVAVTGNGVLIYVVIRTTALHTSTNFFIASLSAGELLTGLFVIPFAGTSAMLGHWNFSPGLCSFVGLMGVLGPSVSALSLLVVSADRCVAISKPLRYASLVTKKSTVVIISGVWAYSLLMSLLPLLRWGQYSYSGWFKMCVMRSSVSVLRRVPEVTIKEILCVFLPVSLVILVVLKTVQHVRGHRRVFVFVPLPVSATSLPPGTNNVNASRSRLKATRTLLLVSVAFVILCLPLSIADVMCHRPSSCYVTAPVLRTVLWLSFLSCVINPIIIMTLNRKFRATLKTMFCRGRKCRLLAAGAGDKEPFTITSGLQAVLEASLLVNIIHGTGRMDANLRRQVILALQSRAIEDPQPSRPGRLSVVALRKTRSTPDCRALEAGRSGS